MSMSNVGATLGGVAMGVLVGFIVAMLLIALTRYNGG